MYNSGYARCFQGVSGKSISPIKAIWIVTGKGNERLSQEEWRKESEINGQP